MIDPPSFSEEIAKIVSFAQYVIKYPIDDFAFIREAFCHSADLKDKRIIYLQKTLIDDLLGFCDSYYHVFLCIAFNDVVVKELGFYVKAKIISYVIDYLEYFVILVVSRLI